MVGMTKWRGAVMLLLGLAVLPSYLRAFKLSGASAAPSMVIGDSFLVNEAAYQLRLPYSHVTLLRTGSPKRGDMVLAMLPNFGPGIKRAMGLPGETIEFRENRVLINGRVLPLEVLNRADFNWVAAVNRIGSEVFNEDGHLISFTAGEGRSRNHAPVRLGAHEFFLVGDNRDESLDSRIWGPIAEERILGKVLVTYKKAAR
jgi:signal peptidase I